MEYVVRCSRSPAPNCPKSLSPTTYMSLAWHKDAAAHNKMKMGAKSGIFCKTNRTIPLWLAENRFRFLRKNPCCVSGGGGDGDGSGGDGDDGGGDGDGIGGDGDGSGGDGDGGGGDGDGGGESEKEVEGRVK